MQKVIYFTAGPVATTEEKADIVKLNTIAEAPYTVNVLNGSADFNYGAGPQEADLVAGTIPDEYEDIPTIDPDNPPGPVLPATDAIVSNGATVVVKNSAGNVSKNGIATVAANAVTGIALGATEAIVSTGATVANVTGTGTTATITVANGVVTGIALS